MNSKKTLPQPVPMIGKNEPVDWLLVFKFNGASFPGCDNGVVPTKGTGIFGGKVDDYSQGHSQQYIYASSKNPAFVKGKGCVGATYTDPLGATFAQVYDNPGYYYVMWNDQFYGNPIAGEGGPWGHSKGMLAWNENGEGFVMQVSTPSWPASGSKDHPREPDGNTLGCIGDDDDIEVSQHFFALKINKDDLVLILEAIANASVVTDPAKVQIVQNGGPADVQKLVSSLGKQSTNTSITMATLSSGVKIISKPSLLASPPWQLVSSQLAGLPLRVASWWARPLIYSTTNNTEIACWPNGMPKPGAVEIATSGTWNGTTIGLAGGDGDTFNHAKMGVSTDSTKPVCIFGDMNQQGALGPNYAYQGQKSSSSQNGRGGTFYVVDNVSLFNSLSALLKGSTAPDSGPNGES